MISILVPAHDEEAVIDRCLRAILDGARPGELEVIVICNGCSDGTAERARAYGDAVTLIHTPVASKTHALNMGERVATGFPRLYVDADVVFPLESIRRVAEALRGPRALAAAPRLHVDLRDRGWLVRAYYRVWTRLPYARDEMIGAGVYGLSEAGRRRFGDFPDTFAEDCFVRMLFAADEKVSVQSASFRVTPPRTARDLVRLLARQRVGTREVREASPEIGRREARRQHLALLALARRPGCWPALLAYLGVKTAGIALYRFRKSRGRHRYWNRDESSRVKDPRMERPLGAARIP